jgi:hypothetical protein
LGEWYVKKITLARHDINKKGLFKTLIQRKIYIIPPFHYFIEEVKAERVRKRAVKLNAAD